jgi:hypothetical protein
MAEPTVASLPPYRPLVFASADRGLQKRLAVGSNPVRPTNSNCGLRIFP